MIYWTVTRESEGYLEDRKSRFLAFLVPLADFERRLDGLCKEHRKANHIITAHRHLLADGRIEESGKDDGEPAGTSGMPTLKVLQGANLVEAAVLIPRYFGGIKLGGGGLARAYSGAAQDAIANAELVPFEHQAEKTLTAGFAASSELEQTISNLGLIVLAREYTSSGVVMTVKGPASQIAKL
ncbi:putative IMPACT (imprinted ancient) family translation regulator [Roseibium hamelinense]|uniref:Putative IMPACT (Imprinted ancient) family translation regulator n=1 Tax=Roseibium hamelinense TaxID=150831 RepID=A0A562SUC4_9HYPH|nr:YigZ family protein [Roseibium hamelinense]MTI43059.1 phosphoenolpyruvate carboxykinase [Roseibium hamelinense]TWI84638.1 putative IMPACT (imprinted ancient) family translation regulator [Roseibium hamelinense]